MVTLSKGSKILKPRRQSRDFSWGNGVLAVQQVALALPNMPWGREAKMKPV